MECSICQERMWIKKTKLSCNHCFHRKCYFQWESKCIEEKKDITCPMCRTIILKVNKCIYCGDINGDVKIGKCGHIAHQECFKQECMKRDKVYCPCCNEDTSKQCTEINIFIGWDFN